MLREYISTPSSQNRVRRARLEYVLIHMVGCVACNLLLEAACLAFGWQWQWAGYVLGIGLLCLLWSVICKKLPFSLRGRGAVIFGVLLWMVTLCLCAIKWNGRLPDFFAWKHAAFFSIIGILQVVCLYLGWQKRFSGQILRPHN